MKKKEVTEFFQFHGKKKVYSSNQKGRSLDDDMVNMNTT